ncbi:MAG: cardiolipin synthase [Tannerellaceae bacterium]|nr:cardiolipin synthase [Tannerellaceae bacterium]
MGSTLITIGIIIYCIFLLRVAYKIIISYDDCNPVKASSWIFVIVFIPVIGLLAHIIVGRNLNKKKSQYEQMRNEVNTGTIPKFGYKENECSVYPTTYHQLKKLLSYLTHLPVFPGNNIEFYSTGQDTFNHLFADMENAKDHIHILYYTFGGDETGQRFRDVIVRKRKEGVKVRLIYDAVGSNQTKNKFFKELIKEGIEVEVFSPIFLAKAKVLPRINYRNHRKIVVIDGKVGYTGGMNVKNEYVYGVKWGIWRDLHMRITGPAAQGLQSIFIVDWYFCRKEYLQSPTLLPPVDNYGKTLIQVVSAEPLGIHRNIMSGMFKAIAQAKQRILIQTPYFVPSSSLMAALQTAAMGGVQITFILPRKSDNQKVQYAANSYLQQLLVCDIKIFQYNKGFIHSKMMIIDDDLTIAGSSNMDIRSLELNFEDMLFIYDKEVTAQATQIFLNDLDDSVELKKEAWMKRPKRQKFIDAFFRLFSPFL